MDLKQRLRSTPVRLAVAYVALFGSSALFLMAFIYWSTAGFMLRQADETIDAEIAGLSDRYRVAGMVGMTALIQERLGRQPSGSSLYLVTDTGYRRLVGNLAAWPRAEADDDGWINFQLDAPQGEAAHWARAKAFQLRGGYRLLAGRDMHELQEIRSLIVRTMIWGLVLTVGLAVGGGLLVSRGRVRRIGEINEALDAIVGGDLGRRIPPDPAGDDIEQLVEHLNQMLDELEQLVDGVRRVSDNIAHDLRTPLTRLKQQLDTLARGGGSGTKAVTVEAAIAEADGLLETFNALLRIARIEAGPERQGFEAVDLGELVDDVADLYGPSFDDRGLRLVTQSRRGPVVEGDRNLLFQALVNLADNALKYVPAGGTVRLEAGKSTAGAHLSVIDDGPGVPPEEREHVLERFYRLDSSRSTPGAGLGLSLVAAVADLHHARLELGNADPGLAARIVFASSGPAAQAIAARSAAAVT